MSRDFWDGIAEFGIKAGLEMIKAGLEEDSTIERGKVADLMVALSIGAASRVARRDRSVHQITLTEFSTTVGTFWGCLAAFFSEIAGIVIEVEDASVDFVALSQEALKVLQQETGNVTVSHAIVKTI